MWEASRLPVPTSGLLTRISPPTSFSSGRRVFNRQSRSVIVTSTQSSLLPEGNPAAAPIAPVLTITDGKPTCLSTDIAQHFGKRHDHVLRDIENLLPQLPVKHAPNFGETSVEVAQPNGGTRESKAYRLSKDGFTLLAMGFTGKRALAFKLAYIDAFNRMEDELLGQIQRTPYSTAPNQTITADEAETLRLVLKTAVEQLPKAQQGPAMIAGWSKLKSHFKVNYRQIPRSEYLEALSIIARHIETLGTTPQTTLPLDITDGNAMQAAKQAAHNYLDKTRAALREGGNLPTMDSIPEEILCGIVADALQSCRFLISFGHGSLKPHISIVPHNAFVASAKDLPRWIETGDLNADAQTLLHITQASNARLLQKLSPPAVR